MKHSYLGNLCKVNFAPQATRLLCLLLLVIGLANGRVAAQAACSYQISGPSAGTTVDVGGTSVSLGDDAITGALPIGFNFNFFGSTYSQFVISSNGFISFDLGASNGCCSGQVLPNAGSPNNLIAGYWEDLNPSLGGSVGYGVFGTAPARRLVVSFTSVPHHPGGTEVTFQIKLHESSNVAEIVNINCPSDGGLHTQGIENLAGDVAFVPSGRNSVSFGSVTETTTFTPIDQTVPSITCPSNISVACSQAVTFSSASATDNCALARVTQVAGLTSGSTFPTGSNTVTFRARDHGTAGVFDNGAGGTFSYNEGDNNQTIALKACESVYGTGNCVVGACGSLTYYYRSGHLSCNCGKAAGQFEFVFANGGYTNVGEDYGGTNALVTAVPFTRVKGPNGCSVPNTWLLANDRLGGNFNDCSFSVNVGTGVTPSAAGSDQTVCGTSATLAGNAPSVGTGTWSIIAGAGGTVTTPSSPTSGFTGVAGNTYTLRWTIAQAPCPSSTDDVIITLGASPTTSNAGPDQVLCGTSATLAANAPTIGTGSWSIISGAGGSIGTAGSPTSGFTGIAGNTYTLRWSISNAPCPNSTDDVVISFTGVPPASNAGPDQTICGSSTTLAGNVPSAGTGTWSIQSGVGGSISSVNSPTSTFTAVPGNIYTLRWTITNSPCSPTFDDVVITTDQVDPSISCPSNLTANTDAGFCNATLSYSTPVGTDNCPSPTTAQISGLASGSAFPLGVTTNVFRVTDASGRTSTCSFTVTVSDNQTPSITCPSNQTVNATLGACTGTATYTAPTGTDNCSGSTTTLTVGQPSGGTFNPGPNTVTYQVTDGAGNSTNCSFTITVVDNQVPALTCPPNFSANVDPGTCTAVLPYPNPTGTDNCPGVNTALTAGLPTGSAFPLGPNTVTFVATDAAGNTASCSFIATIVDNIAPVMTCPASQSVSNDLGLCSAVVNFGGPSVAENCVGGSLTQTAGLPTGSAFPVGVTVNVLQATDGSGNTGTCNFSVTVADNELPVINCQSSITLNADVGSCATNYSFTAPVGTDNCSGVSTAQTGGPSSGSPFTVGVTTVKFTATDAVGNTSSCAFAVTVVDGQAPAINCPAAINLTSASGQCGQVATFTSPVGTDNCTGANTAQTAGFASGSTFPVGTTVNTFTVTDASGTSTSCSFSVIVGDNEAPTISCPPAQTVNTGVGVCTAVVTYAPPTTADNCPAPTLTQLAGLASGGAFPLGMTTNTYQVSDGAGNTASCSFAVTVVDGQNPSWTGCPSNITQNTSSTTCNATVTWTAPTATDNCTVASSSGSHTSGSTFALGATTVTYTATDAAGRTGTCAFTVTVNDGVAPIAVCQGVTVNLDPQGNGSTTSAAVNNGSSDNCTLAGVSLNQTSFTCANAGSAMVVLTATDAAGNTSTCNATVTVIAPAVTSGATANLAQCGYNITCNGANTGVATATGGGGCAPYTYLWSNGAPTAVASGLTAGTYTVTVTDGAGGTSTSSVILTAPAPLSITAVGDSVCPGETDGVVDITATGGNDCQVYTYLWSNNATTEDLSGVGAGTYTVTVTDLAGCTATQSVTVGTHALPAPSFTQSGLVLTSGQVWTSYQWLLNGNNIPGATANTHTATTTGSYSLSVTDANGCTGVSDTTNVIVVGVEGGLGDWNELSLYPNPARGEFRLRTVAPIGYAITVRIHDLYGKQYAVQNLPELSGEVSFDITRFSAGTYFVEVVSEYGQHKLFKLVVQ